MANIKEGSTERIQISINRRNFKSYLELPIFIEKEDEFFVAFIPIFPIVSQARTKEQAVKILKEMCNDYFKHKNIDDVIKRKMPRPKISINLIRENYNHILEPQRIKI
ncbi:MAG: hypothetical protein J7K26_04085 [Candidatus Aenigmarchaeota archaeon]|nr:hypothetical protein [Candidatus Aenigmarchaeota archaeon]